MEQQFPGHDERFVELESDASALLAACERQVVRWGWAPMSVTLHVPEPMSRVRALYEDRRVTEPLDGEPPEEFQGAFRMYGLDSAHRIVMARRRRQSPWSYGVCWSSTDEAIWTASSAVADAGELLELTSYRYEEGRMVASRTSSLWRHGRSRSVNESLVWFEYRDGQLGRVVRASQRGGGLWYPNVQRLTWVDGELERVTTTYGEASVPSPTAGASLRDAVLAWERERAPGEPVVLHGRLERQGVGIIYDARLDRLESEFRDEDVLLERLPALMADAVQAAAEQAVEDGLVHSPFFLEVSATFPPSAELVDDAARRRRQSLPAQDALLLFPEAVALAVIDHASPEALRGCRQIRQLPRRPVTRPHGPEDDSSHRRRSQELREDRDRTERYRRLLQAQLAVRTLPHATEDFVAIVVSNEVDRDAALESRLGESGAEAFRATLRPARPIKLPRGPGHLDDLDDVRLLLRSRGVREEHVKPIAARARWALRLVPGGGRSRLGGRPGLGGSAWPSMDGRPLEFVAQIELADLPDVPGRAQLPADGRLLFFYALGPEERFEPSRAGPSDPARVLYLPAACDEPASQPGGLEGLPSEPLRAAPRLTLPDPSALTHLNLDFYDRAAYHRALERAQAIRDPLGTERSHHQMLGEPTFIQDDPRAYPYARINGWELLLSVHDDTSAGLTIADGGALYFFISGASLAARDWAAVHVEPQSH